MDTLQIGVHFDAFRKFLLLEDGEFGHCLCNQIFEKVKGKFAATLIFQKRVLRKHKWSQKLFPLSRIF